MPADWDVVENEHLDEDLLEQTSSVIQAWFPDAPSVVVSAADLRWKLDDRNPAGRGFMSVAVADGEVVGSMTIVPKRFVLDGEPVGIGEVGDVFTDSRYLRGGEAKVPWTGDDEDRQRYLNRSVFGRLSTETLMRADRSESPALSLYFGVANEAAMPGWIKRLGFRKWTGEPLLTYTRPGPVVVSDRSHLPLSIAAVAERAHAVASKLALASIRGLRVSELRAGADLGPIGELWDRVRTQWRFQPVRDEAWFDYRFVRHPTATYRIWLVHKSGSLVGAYVTRSFRDGRGYDVVHLADRLFDIGVAGLLPAAFATMTSNEHRRALHSYGTWAQEPWPERARKVGAVYTTYQPGLILRDNAAHPLDLSGIEAMPFATATSDNI